MSEEYNKLLDMWREEKEKRRIAEGELSIIKGIGNNSPEMKALKEEVERLKKEIPMIREDVQVELLQKDKRILDLKTIDKHHQKINGELRDDNKKLSKQIQDLDKVKELRSKGLM